MVDIAEIISQFTPPLQAGELVFPFVTGRALDKSSAVGISPKAFADIEARLAGRSPRASEATQDAGAVSRGHQIILGIDPSLRGTGWGVIRLTRGIPTALGFGMVKNPAKLERSRCLAEIARTIRDVIRQHGPTLCCVEGLFFAQNLKTALIMGEARGASLVAAAEAGLEVCEMAPRKAKLAIVGFGGAQKKAVAKMVQRMLNLESEPGPDEADALALALAFAQSQGRSHLNSPKRL